MNRRDLLVSVLGSALCAGCGQNTLGNNFIALVRGRVTEEATPRVMRDYAAKLPYASMSARLGGGPVSLMVLARVQQRDLVWRAGQDFVVMTRAGRVIETGGWPGNIRRTWVRGDDPLANAPHRLSRTVEYVRVVDLQTREEDFDTATVQARLRPVRPERITILGLQFDTLLLEEQNRAQGKDWTFVNRYWADTSNGLVWQSEQHIAPDVPPLRLALIKPAGEELAALKPAVQPLREPFFQVD